MMKKIIFILSFGIIFSLGLICFNTQAVDIPNEFNPGTPACAQKVNENFQTLADAINGIEPSSLHPEFELPFTVQPNAADESLENRNVVILKANNVTIGTVGGDPNTPFIVDTEYLVRMRFLNPNQIPISTNGVPTVYPHNTIYLAVRIDDGSIYMITKTAYGLLQVDDNSYTLNLEQSTYDPVTLSQTIYQDSIKYYNKRLMPYRQNMPNHVLEKIMYSSNDAVIYHRFYFGVRSMLGEPISFNGMTFTDVRVDTNSNGETYLLAKGIGEIYYLDEDNNEYKCIYYRANGETGGDLTGTPFGPGGALHGLFFIP